MRRASRLSEYVTLPGCLALILVASGCGSSAGGFVDGGAALRDAGSNPQDTGVDAGVVDTGPGPDSGPLPDSGPIPDAGPRPDTGPLPDGSVPAPRFTEVSIDDQIVHGQGVVAVDIDGDRDLDLVSSLSLTDAVYLYVNDGSGNFSRVTIGTGVVAMHAAAADLDGDGDMDLAAVGLFQRAGGFTSAGEVVWFENPGNVSGTWTEHSITGPTLWGAIFIEATDLTGDGRADLVVGAIQLSDGGGNPQGNGLRWYRNTGGNFAAGIAVDADLLEVTAVALADVDANGVADIIALGSNSNEVAWWQNSRSAGQVVDTPTFSKRIIANPSTPYALHFVNMDEDPTRELLVTTADTGGSAVYYKLQGLTDPWAETVVATGLGGSLASRIFGADFNGDGTTDVAVGMAEATSIDVYLQNAPREFTAQGVQSGYAGLNWLAGGDFDGDQRVDLVTATYERSAGADQLSWWRND